MIEAWWKRAIHGKVGFNFYPTHVFGIDEVERITNADGDRAGCEDPLGGETMSHTFGGTGAGLAVTSDFAVGTVDTNI